MTGKLLIWLGLGAALLGALLVYAPGAFSWFGRLPGDIRIEREHSLILIPITSMVLVSIILSILSYFFRR